MANNPDPAPGEVHRPAYASGYPHISHNLPFPQACAKHITHTFHASRVYIIASGSLSENTDHVRKLQDVLGEKVVGTRHGMKSHTLWSEILEVTRDARGAGADLIVTLGAGSLTDGAKIVATAMANDARTFADLDKLHSGDDWSQTRHDLKPPTVPIISVPTSLSGGEYSFLGGGTNDENHRKYGFGHPTVGPALVILDPQLTTSTPEHVWLQSGVRALDHCVEGCCSLKSTEASDANAAKGLKLLVPGLLRTKADPSDLKARFDCQLAVIEAMSIVFQHGVPMGASHGIGHQLGPMGVGHGETSCVLLPAVCKHNKSANGEKQKKLLEILWQDDSVKEVLASKGLEAETSDLGDVLDVIISSLGMPRSLKAVGVEGEDKLDRLAKNSLHDKWCATNPKPLTEKAQVMEILEMVKG
ncbi:hypothetical protein M409DRAFT_60355 [Zasmidium cellare ATCC 36951]|uniref:Uncharacterized protein n=1 Tax=Zasmidium cellare ATCC 36951 TaxID=1080233 RepID=A0A6A6BYS4_ZASCE|nr:uncharacterized protein M409DRAFT_60355 [Zasmidium cellare ATCC 36951]KAF2159944.1 hypothetical protein M409DRAFT_60355 [Zasmidium cellare ATCC 36951]